MNKKTILPMLVTGLTLGTAWAVRRKFGHEQGAAWAGAIGGIVIVLLSARKDWYQKVYSSALAAAIGWGMGGMMSYGIVVGYGRANDFPNAFYGLLMLFVIGSLYGLTGGGLLGLALIYSKEKRVDWARLMVEMTIGGFLFYGFFVSQLGWKMTPPRSEMWGGCMGAGLALVWFLHRNNYKAPLKVALFSMLGAGFGFASGNFLQTLIQAFEIPFSGWNTMEYSIGFWGGLGMAYGVFTAKWDESKTNTGLVQPASSKIALLIVALIIPFIVWQQTFTGEKMLQLAESLNWQKTESVAIIFRFMVITLIVIMAVVLFVSFYRIKDKEITGRNILLYFIMLFAVYIIISDIRTGSYFTWAHLEQKLYWINFVVILYFISRNRNLSWPENTDEINKKLFWRLFIVSILIIALFAIISINSHEQLQGSHQRFLINE